MAMLPRIKPRTFYDLVIEVAIVRPGPIQGDMVHPYLRRREGQGGGRLSQARAGEGARQDAGRAAVPGAGDAGRHRMRRLHRQAKPTSSAAAWRPSSSPAASRTSGQADRRHGRQRLRARRSPSRLFKQLEGFGSYGFPESHAASFALIAYASSWLKCHHPDVFCAALLNAQPMGFYAPGADRPRRAGARRRGPAGLRQRLALGLHAGADAGRGPLCRAARPAHGARPRQRRCRRDRRRPRRPALRLASTTSGAGPACRQPALVRLAEADAFRPALGLARREALWAIKALRDEPLPLFAAAVGPRSRDRAGDPTSRPSRCGR